MAKDIARHQKIGALLCILRIKNPQAYVYVSYIDTGIANIAIP